MSSAISEIHERSSSRLFTRIYRGGHLALGGPLLLITIALLLLILISSMSLSLLLSTLKVASATPPPPFAYSMISHEEGLPPSAVDERQKRSRASALDLERLSSELSLTLKVQASSARLWWGAWTSIFGGFALYNMVPAMLNITPFPLEQATPQVLWTNGVKSLLGTANMFIRPYSSLNASDDFERALKDPNIPLSETVRRGERSLIEAVREKKRRFGIFRHLSSVMVNAIGGLILYFGYDDLRGALRTSALGIVSSQIYIWTQPWSADRDLRNYQRLKARLNGFNRVGPPPLKTPDLIQNWTIFSGFGSVYLRVHY